MSSYTPYTINPSRFNRRLTVKRATTATDDAGGTANTGFTERFTCWGYVAQMSNSRKAYFGLDLFTDYWEVQVRYREFNVSDIIDYGTQSLSVQGVQNIYEGYKRFTVLTCVLSNVTV